MTTFHVIDPNDAGASRGICPKLSVEIDFTNEPTNATRVWTDVTTDVRALDFTGSGRANELQRTTAGSMSGILDNTSGDYDPSYTGGSYYPNVKRMRWMRVQAQWASVTYSRWTGLIDTWSVQWPGSGHDSLVAIRGTDAFKVLNLFSLNGLSYSSETSDVRVGNVLDDVGGLPYTVDTAASETLVAAGPFTTSDMALAHLLAVEETENGLLFVGGDGSVQFQGRHYRLLNSATSVATIGDGAGEVPYRDASYDMSDEDIWNTWVVTPSGGTAESASDSTSATSYYTRSNTRSLLVSSQTTAQAAADYLAARYGDSSPRVPAAELIGPAATTKWPEILGLDNSNRVTWKRRADYATISSDFFVERVSDKIRPGGADWTVTVELSPAVDQSGWLLGDSTYGVLGETTRLTY